MAVDMTNIIDLHTRQPMDVIHDVTPEPLVIRVRLDVPPPPPQPAVTPLGLVVAVVVGLVVFATLTAAIG